MSGICDALGAFSARIEVDPAAMEVGSFRSRGGIRERTNEALSYRNPRDGEEGEAFDAIDLKLPLSFRSAVPR